VCTRVCVLKRMCVLSAKDFSSLPTFEIASLLIKQLIVHLTRKKVNKLSNKNKEAINKKKEINVNNWDFPVFL